MVSIVASIVISKFLHCTILVTISGKCFFQQNFNLKMTRIQRGIGSWMLLDALLSLFHCWEGFASPRLKNVMFRTAKNWRRWEQLSRPRVHPIWDGPTPSYNVVILPTVKLSTSPSQHCSQPLRALDNI
jgi:hypothetical protein